jgi:tetratricopeptide (TPR) repeat protein
LFEAGAIANSMTNARVCPLLVDLSLSDFRGPLAEFQACEFSEAGIFKLLRSVNAALESGVLSESQLSVLFRALWPGFEGRSRSLPNDVVDPGPERTTAEILNEVLELCRMQANFTTSLAQAMINKVDAPETPIQLPGGEKGLFNALLTKADDTRDVREARALRDKGNITESVAAYRKALERNPGNDYILTEIAVTESYLPQKDYKSSISMLDGILTRNPNLAKALYNRACLKNLVRCEDPATDSYSIDSIMEDLRRATALYGRYRHVASLDTDFENLRGLPQFEEFLHAYQEKAAVAAAKAQG